MSPAERHASRPLAVLVASALVFGLVARVLHLRVGAVDGDEFEHVHAAWSIARGQQLYTECFEHHPPLAYIVGSWFVPAAPRGVDTVLAFRWLGLLASLMTAALVVRAVDRSRGRAEAVATAVLLAANAVWCAYGSLVFLDTFAAPAVAVALLALAAPALGARRAGVAVFAWGLACLCTQKAMVAAPAVLLPLLGAIAAAPAGRRWPTAARLASGAAVGGALAAAVLLASTGWSALGDAWAQAFVLNAHWRTRHFPWDTLTQAWHDDAGACVLTIAGLAAAAMALLRRRLRTVAADVPALFAGAMALGLVALPVVWEEYFALAAPFLAIAAAGPLAAAWRAFADAQARPWTALRHGPVVALAAGHVLAAAVLVRALGAGGATAAVSAAALAGGVVCGVHVLQRVRHGRAPSPVAAVLPLLLAAGAGQVRMLGADLTPSPDSQLTTLAEQRERVAFVMATTPPDAPFFDGFSGQGVFRPHAYWCWLLHDEMQVMCLQEPAAIAACRGRHRDAPWPGFGNDLLAALVATRPPLASLDPWLLRGPLPREVRDWLTANYEPTRFADLWQRKAAAGTPVDAGFRR